MSAPTTIEILSQIHRNLAQVLVWIDKTSAYAEATQFDPDTLLTARLYPNMFPLTRQLGAACDTAKLAVSRLSGVDAPKHADDQATWGEVRERVQSVLDWMQGVMAEATFEGAADQRIRFPWYPGHSLIGDAYLKQFAMPNFYFHASMTYAILRHNGVPLGKLDFLGHLPFEADAT